MARAPLAILAIISITMAFQLMFVGEAPITEDHFANATDDFDEPGNETGLFQFFQDLGSILGMVWDGIRLFFALLTFSLIDGVPGAVQIPIAVTMVGGFLWSIISLIGEVAT